MNADLQKIVRDAGFVEDAEYGYKCSADNIERLAHFLINQMGAMSFWETHNTEIPEQVTSTCHNFYELNNINWMSEPKYTF
jgi:hypothetical protein